MIIKLTKETAQAKLLDLCKKGIRWYDQGMGHGHYKFVLEQDQFFDMFDVLKFLDGLEKKKQRKARA